MEGIHSLSVKLAVLTGLALTAGCDGGGPREDASSGPQWRAERVTVLAGFDVPESVLVGGRVGAVSVYVSNLQTPPDTYWADDGKGFISLLEADGILKVRRWIESAGATRLSEPKGMCLVDDILHVADIIRVAAFPLDGRRPRVTEIAGARQLNDMAAYGGVAYVSDTGTGKIHKLSQPPRTLKAPQSVNGIAFDEAGRRAWVFVSEMDPAVFRAAKTYWFKSAPGHEGIHGLHTGVFLGGQSQAFVGSACTLEILDEHGACIKRMPQFWGKVSTMRIIPGMGDSLNLLAARKYNGTNNVAVINNQTLDPSPRSFYSVPTGHTHVPGWSSMNRHHLFYEDFDGDGAEEVMSEINGFWNRVTVWSANGAAKYDASFGPGQRIPALNMRDIDTGDLDGDGLPEIVIGTVWKMVVALDGTCEEIWAKRLPAAPNVLACVPPWIVVGCDDGVVRVLDQAGDLIRSAKLSGAPTTIQPVTLDDGRRCVVFGTQSGEVILLDLAE